MRQEAGTLQHDTTQRKQGTRRIALKIDVDTRRGMKQGVSNLLRLLGKHRIKASFFLSFGPDTSGRAIFNIFRKKGFLRKMLRTKAAAMYGWGALFYGTLLPAPMTASAFPDMVKRIEDEGHEVALHAWNHRRWQDHLPEMSVKDVEREVYSMLEAYVKILTHRPAGAGAPGWMVTGASLGVQDRLNLKYASDTRMGSPFKATLKGRTFRTVQIPTNQPCIEELITCEDLSEDTLLSRQLAGLEPDVLNVMPLHAEVEGMKYLAHFERLLKKALGEGYAFLRMIDAAGALKRSKLPAVEITFAEIPGRAGAVAVSG
jgi:peptidoglycan/xylan/chitin deacetylase (PgdA/CDA1 family)